MPSEELIDMDTNEILLALEYFEVKILYSIFEKRTKLIFHTAWELANRKNKIKLNK